MTGSIGFAEPQRVTFQQLMTGRYFIIPDYQRHYAWRQKEWEELFNDIVATARKPDRQRFMSTITTVLPAGNSVYPSYVDKNFTELRPQLVVDGQQRLTTLMILIAAICGHMKAARMSGANAEGAYIALVRAQLQDGPNLPRLVVQEIPNHPEVMRKQFAAAVSIDPSETEADAIDEVIPAQKRLAGCRQYFDQRIRSLAEHDPGLTEILTCITGRLIFIINTLGDAGQAGEVFEGINNRGLGLSVLENIKAYLVYAVQSFREKDELPAGTGCAGTPSQLIDIFNESIGNIYNRFDRVGLKDELARFMIVAAWPTIAPVIEAAGLSELKGYEITTVIDRNTVAEEFRECLAIEPAYRHNEGAKLLDLMAEVVATKLVPAAEFFCDARRPKAQFSFDAIPAEYRMEIADLHQRLVDMSCTGPFLPLLIAYRMVWRNDNEGYRNLSRLIERVAFWVYFHQENSFGKGQKHLAELARRVASGELSPADVYRRLVTFAQSKATEIGEDCENPTSLDFDESDDEFKPIGPPAMAYEWWLSKGVPLPSFASFIKMFKAERFVFLVPEKGARTAGYSSEAQCLVGTPANIIITQNMTTETKAELRSLTKEPYSKKLQTIKELGFPIDILPASENFADAAQKLVQDVNKFSKKRWSINKTGLISSAPWKKYQPVVDPYDEDVSDDESGDDVNQA